MKKNKPCKFGLNSCYFDGKEERKSCCAINSSMNHLEIDNVVKLRIANTNAVRLAQERVCKAAAAYMSAWNECFEFGFKAETDDDMAFKIYSVFQDEAALRDRDSRHELNAALISLQKIGYNFK